MPLDQRPYVSERRVGGVHNVLKAPSADL